MITQVEVGGIPAVLAPTTGPMQAGLAFRVGVADEPLAKRGITHLIEHLALHSFGPVDHHHNGATGVEYTYFHTQGTAEEIVAFLNGVCAGLSDPPMPRLAVEKEILRTEQSSRGEGPTDALAMWRHGARDYGVATYPEWGLTGIDEDDLRDWIATYFTRENAALWIAGPEVPAGLELRLPSGERRSVPVASSALPVRPAYFPGPSNVVAWNAVVRREARAAVFAGVLDRALLRSLRQESGLSYTVMAGYEPRADGTGVISAFADALAEKQSAVLDGFVGVLAAARLGEVGPAEVTTVIEARCTELAQAEETGGRLAGQAFNLLAGRPVQSLDEAVAELRAVTPADVAEVAAAAVADGLLMTPGRTTADTAGYVPAPDSSESLVEGAEHASLQEPGLRLIAGADGVSLVNESQATVLFDRCAAVLVWPDGARRFVGEDGIQVHLEPTLFGDGHAVIAELDTRIRPETRTPMPPRDPKAIPVPPASVPQARRGRRARTPLTGVRRVLTLLVLLLQIPVALLFGGGGILLETRASSAPYDQDLVLAMAVFCLAVAVVMTFGAIGSIRRLRGLP
ncbi:insulinase family protein [Actinoplanes sp. NPDC051851]|uniref:M16 family metallopeptidase n=1 Tax=Actinoplanes sp. NPDC051851 TaxID=3154753 RepID=UPI0034277B5A